MSIMVGQTCRSALTMGRRSNAALPVRAAFTLIEVMVVVVLLSLIVIALMAVFNSTQAAFRASVTQTDVLESGRAAMDLITGDLRAMSPSLGISNVVVGGTSYKGPVNFYAGTNYAGSYQGNPPLIQSLVASSGSRTNVQQDIFMLSRDNLNGVPTWFGTGYAVCLSPSNTYSLYRFSTNRPVGAVRVGLQSVLGGFSKFPRVSKQRQLQPSAGRRREFPGPGV